MKRLLKWFGIALLVVLVPLLLVLGALAVIGGTEKGFNLAAREAAKRVAGLELGEFRGSLAAGIATDTLSFENESLRVEAAGVDTAWRLGCLTTREFCLDRVIIDELAVTTFATDEAPPPSDPSEGIALPDIALPVDLTLTEVRVRTLRFQPPGDAPEQVLEDVSLSARTRGDRLLLDNASLRYGSYDAALSGDMTLTGDYPLDLALALDLPDIVPAPATAPGDPAPTASGTEGGTATDDGVNDDDGAETDTAATTTPVTSADAATRDLRVDVALGNTLRALDVRAETSGALEAVLEGRVQPLESDLPAELVLSVPSVGWPLDSGAQVLARDLGLSVDGTLDDYALALAMSVTGEQVPDTALALSGRANTERLELADIGIDTLDGRIAGDAALTWVEGIDWRVALDIAGLDPSLQLDTLSGELGGEIRASGTIDGDNWTLELPRTFIDGTLQGRPFTLDARLNRALDGRFVIETFALDNGANRVRADGSVGERWDIGATIDLPRLQNLLPALVGGFDATLALSGPLAEPDATLEARTAAITFNDLSVRDLRLRADVARAGIEPSALSLTIDEAGTAEQRAANVRLALEGTRQRHALTLFADGPQATAIDLAASGALSETFDWLGRLDATTIDLPAHVVRLREPLAMAWDNAAARLTVEPHCWVSQETNLCLENAVRASGSGSATISIDRYLLGRLDPFLPADSTLNGSLAATATARWGDEATRDGFSARLALAIENGGATVIDTNEEPVTFTYDDLTLEATFDPTVLDANLAISSETMGEATVVARLDPATEGTPINGRVNLDGFRIDVVQAFAPEIETITGTLNINGDVSGRLADPRFDGEIVLDEPIVRADTLPLAITGGRVSTFVRGKRAFIEGRLASDEGGIDIEGSANWQRIDAWRADVTLTGSDLSIRQAPLTDSRVNHEIAISARPGRIRVSGEIDVPTASINVRELPQGAATLSDDIVVIEDIPDTPTEGPVVAPAGLDLVVEIEVTLGEEVAVDAYGLTANLTGDMGISLRSPRPVQLGGEIEVVDGIFKQYGQNLEASGQILFVGPVSSTALAIEAIRRIPSEEPERIAGLRITGTIDSPDIELFTEPGDKSEEAVLSYIVLGRDLGETSDQSAGLLASAALALSVRGGRTIGSGIADTLGIEEFAFETQGSGDDTELVASGRINDRLLLRYGQSVFEPGQTLYLRYDLTRRLYLEAAQSVSQGVSQAVDLFYKFSF